MKSRLLLIPLMLTAATAMADSETFTPSNPVDAHAQAAALLSRPYTPGVSGSEGQVGSQSEAPATVDAQARAAALLSGVHTGSEVAAFVQVDQTSRARVWADAHNQAAALLSTSLISGGSQQRTQQARGGAYTSGQNF